jgi:hypothetical protein
MKDTERNVSFIPAVYVTISGRYVSFVSKQSFRFAVN